jgi:hypothetical protein
MEVSTPAVPSLRLSRHLAPPAYLNPKWYCKSFARLLDNGTAFQYSHKGMPKTTMIVWSPSKSNKPQPFAKKSPQNAVLESGLSP